MSHSVTIRTQTTVRSTSSVIIINIDYLKSWTGILKVLQLALGIACVTLSSFVLTYTSCLAFLLITTTFMIGTFILLLSCLTSLSTSFTLSKTVYELMYHSIAFIAILIVSGILLSFLNQYWYQEHRKMMLSAGIIGVVNSVLYLFSSIIAYCSYKRT